MAEGKTARLPALPPRPSRQVRRAFQRKMQKQPALLVYVVAEALMAKQSHPEKSM